MKNGYLSQYFESVAAKKLSAVEVNTAKSNQHEFNGSRELKHVLKTGERKQLPTKFLWIGEENEGFSEDGFVTWYDARESNPLRSEYRLYFSSNPAINIAKEGDTMFIAKRTDETLLIVLTPSDSTIENQLYWLFGLTAPTADKYEVSDIDQRKDHVLDFTSRFILDELEIEIEEPENDKLDGILYKFSGKFPSTIEFSQLARDTIGKSVNEIEDPDNTLLDFMEWEEKLFRRLERHIVSARLKNGFNNEGTEDVDGFIKFSLGVQNRRKTRVGHAFEHHLTHILKSNKLLFSNGAQTENKSKPDFIFPGINYYNNPEFPQDLLTMLGAKTSCKDRWRQVLSEASKIKQKHLITLEPGISLNQTNEMRANGLQLVLPKSIQSSYSLNQQKELIDLKSFIVVVKDKQGII